MMRLTTRTPVSGSVQAGRMLFIPGNAQHQINNPHDEDLMILYAFAISDFGKVEYSF